MVGFFLPRAEATEYQAEVLARSFEAEGATVLRTTYARGKFARPPAIGWFLLRHARKYDTAIVQGFSYWSFVNAVVALVVLRFLGKRAILFYRGGGGPDFLPRLGPVHRLVLALPHAIVVPSGYLKAAFERLGHRATILPNVLNVSRWPFRERDRFRPRLLWVRHLRPGYNPLMALRVFRRVREVHADATLMFVGDDGPARPELESAIARDELAGVELLGWRSQQEIVRIASDADIFLNTTYVDNQPNSVIEAMSLGLLVISTDVGGIPYLVTDGENGFLVKSEDDDAMARAVLAAIADPSGSAAICRTARARIEHHDWTHVREGWAALL